MSEIVKGTTPTIQYTFKTVKVEDIAVAMLTIKQGGELLIEKNLAAAVVGAKDLSWTLSQQETLLMESGAQIEITLNWRTADGTRGIGKKLKVYIEDNDIEEVI